MGEGSLLKQSTEKKRVLASLLVDLVFLLLRAAGFQALWKKPQGLSHALGCAVPLAKLAGSLNRTRRTSRCRQLRCFWWWLPIYPEEPGVKIPKPIQTTLATCQRALASRAKSHPHPYFRVEPLVSSILPFMTTPVLTLVLVTLKRPNPKSNKLRPNLVPFPTTSARVFPALFALPRKPKTKKQRRPPVRRVSVAPPAPSL